MLRQLADEILGWQAFVDAFAHAHYGWEPWIALRSLAAIYLCVCTLAFSLRATWVFLPALGVPMRWGTVLAVGMWTSTVGFHVLRGIGAFNLPCALLACTLLLLASLRALPQRISLQRAARREWRAVRRVAALVRRSRYNFLTACFAAVGCLFALRGLIIPPLGWDTFTYHGPRAALWLQTGQLTFDPGPSVYMLYRHFFAGGEVFMAWAMLPFHSDLLVNATSIVQWLGLGLSTWAIARELGAREPYAATSAGLIMFAPVVLASLNSGYVDIVLGAALLQGIALAIACLRRFRASLAIVATMAMGVAAGIKLTGIAPAVVFAVPLALRGLAEPTLRAKHKLALLAAGASCAVLPAAPWLWLAWSETGAPFSPIPIKVAGLTLGVSNAAVDWYNDWPHLVPYTWDFELGGLRTMFEPVREFAPTLGSLCVLPMLAFPFGLIVLARRQPLAALLLTAAVMSAVFMHFSPAMNTTRLLLKWSPARYLMAAVALAFVVGSMIGRSRFRGLASAYRYLALLYPLHAIVLGLRWGWSPWETRELLIVAALIAIGCVAVRSCSGLRRQLPVAALLFAVGCSALQVRRDETRQRAFEFSFALHGGNRYWGPLTSYIDHKPRRIAITGGPNRYSDHWLAYFLLGPRLENRVLYVPPTRDGGIADVGPLGDFESRA
ncbi:MAG TPA: hypothetical protein VJR89_24600, partial [Polyangiales bacterium]|nr:hypothetical protein [Polyangiales bacterium]